MDVETYRQLRVQGQRLSRTSADRDDLVQDTLLVALQAGRSDPAWLHGVMRNLAVMQARGAARRRRREATSAPPAFSVAFTESSASIPTRPAWLDRLPSSARRIAVLALHGLSAREIQWLLDIAPTAFRQRLSRIRRGIEALAPAERAEARALAGRCDPYRRLDLRLGVVRRSLQQAMGTRGLGTHDLDGHLLVIDRGPGRAFRDPA